MAYKQLKRRLRKRINDFNLTDDLFYLAEAYLLINEIMEGEEFPLQEFVIYKQNEKQTEDSTL